MTDTTREALSRVQKYLAELARIQKFDQEEINRLHVGDEREAVLLVSDLNIIIAAANAVQDSEQERRIAERDALRAEGFEQCKEMAAKAFDVRRIYGAAIVRALQYPGQQAEAKGEQEFLSPSEAVAFMESELGMPLEQFVSKLDDQPPEQGKCKECQAKQAEIDRLMLEFCPSEMTAEQKAEWARHQRRADQPANAAESDLAHSDHPARHYDRTCQACNAAPTEARPKATRAWRIALNGSQMRVHDEGFEPAIPAKKDAFPPDWEG